jgi:MFS family permease
MNTHNLLALANTRCLLLGVVIVWMGVLPTTDLSAALRSEQVMVRHNPEKGNWLTKYTNAGIYRALTGARYSSPRVAATKSRRNKDESMGKVLAMVGYVFGIITLVALLSALISLFAGSLIFVIPAVLGILSAPVGLLCSIIALTQLDKESPHRRKALLGLYFNGAFFLGLLIAFLTLG